MENRRAMSFIERDAEFEGNLASAKTAEDPDRRLSLLLTSAETMIVHRVKVASVLGRLRGNYGSRALAEEFRAAVRRMEQARTRQARQSERDLICSCVAALAQRQEHAMDIYIVALEHADLVVSDYGVAALASSDDDSAWENVFQMLKVKLQRPIAVGGVMHSWSMNAIDYLSKHAPAGSDRAVQLTELLQANWKRVSEKEWIKQRVPGIQS